MSQEQPLITPGEILAKEFLEPLGVTPYQLAKRIHVPVGRITAILRGERAITADTATRLGIFFGVQPQWFLNLQSFYDLSLQSRHLDEIRAQVKPLVAA